ncbi:hypothetical protein CLI64_12355 [Nostoc sp. CENA543]|uniref:hypothetical protein n=1 Tax=Nostoc sp. CENA543 TaxID=1869241 RepID=UPI000CA1D616|nr:hypothetical protein [Nostoc sp. CENA543]AUT01132.1 hypothetical protein CLI64_12355 [Nostoc sp. CENA543]
MLQYISYFTFLLFGVLIVFILYIAYLYLTTVIKLNKALRKSQLPAELVNFPIYISTIEEYLSVKGRVNAFIEAGCNNTSFELHLTANDLNCLRNKGSIPDRQSLKRPEYYEIKQNNIIERRVVFPWPFNRHGCINETKSIKFVVVNDSITEQNTTIARHEKEMLPNKRKVINYPLVHSKLLLQIFNFFKSSQQERQNLLNVINNIKKIEVTNDEITLYI